MPFSHPDWLFELKHDGFRGIAIIKGHHCTLFSRHGRQFAQWPQLAEEIAHSLRTDDAILDGEIVCMNADGSSNFNALLRRRGVASLSGVRSASPPMASTCAIDCY